MATGACDNRSVCSVQGPVVGHWSISWGGGVLCPVMLVVCLIDQPVLWCGQGLHLGCVAFETSFPALLEIM